MGAAEQRCHPPSAPAGGASRLSRQAHRVTGGPPPGQRGSAPTAPTSLDSRRFRLTTAPSQGRRSLVGCRLWGRTESDTTEVTQQQQQHVFPRAAGSSWHLHTHVDTHTSVDTHTCKGMCTQGWLHTRVDMCMHTRVATHVDTCEHMCEHMTGTQVWVHTWTHSCGYTRVWTHAHTIMDTHVDTCEHTHVWVYTRVWTQAINTHVDTHVNTFVDVYTCVDTGTHNHGYTWTVCGHTHTRVDIHTCVDTGTHNRGYTRVDTQHTCGYSHVWTHMHTQAGYTHSELQIQGWAAP